MISGFLGRHSPVNSPGSTLRCGSTGASAGDADPLVPRVHRAWSDAPRDALPKCHPEDVFVSVDHPHRALRTFL